MKSLVRAVVDDIQGESGPGRARAQPLPIALCHSIHHVQETFGGIQDIRYDSKPYILIPVFEKILAPLRTSDRKKLRQRVIQEFSLSPEIGDLLVPDGLLSVKYTTHSRVPGVCNFLDNPSSSFSYSIASRWRTSRPTEFHSGSQREKGLIT